MKIYTITRDVDPQAAKPFRLVMETDIVRDAEGKKVRGYQRVEMGADSRIEHCGAPLLADYYGVAIAPGVERFIAAFLAPQRLKPGDTYRLSSEVLDRWVSVQS